MRVNNSKEKEALSMTSSEGVTGETGGMKGKG